jgi:hypothetical protein
MLPNPLNGSLRAFSMPLSEQEFRAWSYRNGGETYGRPDSPGTAYHFPGAVDTTMQPDEVRDAMQLLEPADIANAIVFAVSQPEYVSVNDIQIRPTEQEF